MSKASGELPSNTSIQMAIASLLKGDDLSSEHAKSVFEQLMSGELNDGQIGALLFGLAKKGESIDEIVAAAQAMRAAVIRVPTAKTPLIDTCGTGGSGMALRNISSAVAICAAACGVAVAKHGNRAATSRSGSADVLEALGVNIGLSPERVGHCVDEVGVGFLFARQLHPAMKYAGFVRQTIGIRTVFNLLGPLTNPAGAARQAMGVYDPGRCIPLAQALGRLGAERALVIHGLRADGSAGADDISLEGETLIGQWHRGQTTMHRLTAADAQCQAYAYSELAGGSAQENAGALQALLQGAKGAYREAVVYAGAIALLAAGDDPIDTLPTHARRIRNVLDSGQAAATLQNLLDVSNRPS